MPMVEYRRGRYTELLLATENYTNRSGPLRLRSAA